jgi:8-oxo-dGTP diphosphatase
MKRDIRYQGAIIHEHHILLIRHQEHEGGRSYWVFPGGGIEAGESEEDCVCREMREETILEVRVERLLLDEPCPGDDTYQKRRTYLCSVLSGTAAPGYEPEAEVAEEYGIVEVGWFDLRDDRNWPELLTSDAVSFPQLRKVRQLLGYQERGG